MAERIDKAHMRVLTMIGDRTDERSPDPGVICSCATFADAYNVFVHWRTTQALRERGLVEHPFRDPDGWSIALTAAGWEVIGRTPPAHTDGGGDRG